MKKLIIILLAMAAVIAVILSVVIPLDTKYNLRNFFQELQSESSASYIQVLFRQFVQDKDDNPLFEEKDLEKGTLEIVFCARNNRVYFGYSSKVPETKAQYKIWHIASVDMQGKDFQEHYVGNLFDDAVISPDFMDLSTYSDRYERYGGFYDGEGRIFLRGNPKIICFYPDTGHVEEAEKLPDNPYTWEIKDHQSITISDGTTQKTITLESMAEKSACAKQIATLSSYKNWDEKSFLCNFFKEVKVVGNQVYLLCEVLNWVGARFAVEFQYDFQTEQVTYMTSQKISDTITFNYSIAALDK